MKKILIVFLIALLALTVLVLGVFLFRCFATDRIIDKDGMTNPDDTDEMETIQILDGEPLLDDYIQFVYLQPGAVRSTDFSLDSYVLQRKDGTPAGEIAFFYHEVSNEDISGSSTFTQFSLGIFFSAVLQKQLRLANKEKGEMTHESVTGI